MRVLEIKHNKDGSFTTIETKEKTFRISESEKAEIRKELARFYGEEDDAVVQQCKGDGYYAQQISQEHHGLPLETLAELSGFNERRAQRQNALRKLQW